MPRQKKQRLKKRKDGYFVCRYKNQWFYSLDEDDCLAQREVYKELEKSGEINLLTGPTLKEYADKWFSTVKTRSSKHTKNEAKIQLRKLTDTLGDKYIAEILPSDIRVVYSTRFAGLSDSYIRRSAQLYRALFEAAVDDGYCKSNPARKDSAKPEKGTSGKHRAITEQERKWIETLCTDHRAHGAVMAMLYAGIRPQEVKAMNIDRSVNFETGEIRLIDFAHMENYNQYKITDKGKTDKAARTIPLFTPLRKVLEGKHGMLISSAKGTPVTVTAWKSVYASYVTQMETVINGCHKRWYGKTKEHKKILAEGGTLPPWIEFTVVPYDLRYSFCTWCRDNGVELKTCVRWMGHTDAKMILKIYDDAPDSRSKLEAEKLENKLFRSENGSGNQEK